MWFSTSVRAFLIVSISYCFLTAHVAPVLQAQTDGQIYLPLIRSMTATVTTTEDELNNDGDCSLREAIQAVNTNHRVDQCSICANVIVLSAGTYTLTLPAGTADDDNTVGDLDITGTLTIYGVGANSLRINGNRMDRVLQVHPNSHITITHVTIENGQTHNGADSVAPERGGDADPGGGIANAGA